MDANAKFAELLRKLEKAEIAAQKAQAERDAAERRWDRYREAIKADPELFKLWLEHCEKTGKVHYYNFSDILC